MVGAEDAFAFGEDTLVQFHCLLVLPEATECVGEVVAAGEGLRVVGAEKAFVASWDRRST